MSCQPTDFFFLLGLKTSSLTTSLFVFAGLTQHYNKLLGLTPNRWVKDHCLAVLASWLELHKSNSGSFVLGDVWCFEMFWVYKSTGCAVLGYCHTFLHIFSSLFLVLYFVWHHCDDCISLWKRAPCWHWVTVSEWLNIELERCMCRSQEDLLAVVLHFFKVAVFQIQKFSWNVLSSDL